VAATQDSISEWRELGAQVRDNILRVQIDGENIGDFPVSGVNTNPAVAPMAGSIVPVSDMRGFFGKLKSGKTLTVSSTGFSVSVGLDGIDEGIQDLFSCSALSQQ
jgi:hypothetical protein